MPSTVPDFPPPPAPAVFLDRDGTIMRDVEYCGDPSQVEVFEFAPVAIRKLKAAGFKICIITNQSGLGRGYFTLEAYRAVEQEVARQVGAGLIDGTYFCPDLPDSGSPCRKPAPGMILEAARDHAVDLKRSFMVGDKLIDARCGHNAGVRSILVHTGFEQHTDGGVADWQVRDLAEAAEIILRHAQ